MNLIKKILPSYKTKAEVLKENEELKKKLKMQETKMIQGRQIIRECEAFYDVQRDDFLNDDFARMHLFRMIGNILQKEFPVKRQLINEKVARYSVKIVYVEGIHR